ncbi:retinol dehydrogenase 12 [Hypoxylon sp. NC1633]|nr:retinol dehydrogenase 12 [Hypoxylon sp. NC1633]
MAVPTFSTTEVEQRAGILIFLRRQLFEKPTLSQKDLKGKTAVVTGANTGIGFECASQLLDLGIIKLIITVRDEAKGQAARTKLLSGRSVSDRTVEVWQLDLQSYESITAFVERARGTARWDMVVLIAAISKQSFELTPSTGHEETIQVNVISTALLTILLLPILKNKTSTDNPSRLVIVSSDTASWVTFKEKHSVPLLPALDKEETFANIDRYPTSKLLGQLFVTELTKRVPSSVAIITMPNPGWCYSTSLGQVPGGSIGDRIISVPRRILGRTASVGAYMLTDAAVQHGQEAHGQYIEDCKIQPKAPFVYTPEGDQVAKILWDELMSELSFAKVEDILKEVVN